jgi:cell wall-associated NlpC family hydrolase
VIQCCSTSTSINSIELLDAAAHISKTGSDGVRLTINGGIPTGSNAVGIDASVAPTLTVEYRLGGNASETSNVDTLYTAAARTPVSFSRNGAVSDADNHVNLARDFPYSPIAGTDCTNFVSQAWHFGGGLAQTSSWFVVSEGWARYFSPPWAAARNFAEYQVNRRKIATYRKDNPAKAYNTALPGDAILYDWGTGEGWSHLAIEVGWDGAGDFIDQHTKDRFHSPWNLGYLLALQFRPKEAPLNKAMVVHVTV